MHASHRFSLLTVVLLVAALLGFRQGSAQAEQAAGQEQKTMSVAVLDFQDTLQGWAAKIVVNALVAELAKRPLFVVVERGRINEAYKELKLQQSGMTDATTAAAIGKQCNAQYIVFGDVQTAEIKPGGVSKTAGWADALRAMGGTAGTGFCHAEVSVNYRVVEVESGKVLLAKVVKGQHESALNQLGQPAIGQQQLVEAALTKTTPAVPRALVPPAEGAVIDVDKAAGTFRITLGKQDGLAAESYVLVYRKGKETKDPRTGEVLEVETVEICRGRCAEARERISIVEAGEKGKVSFYKVNKKKASEVKEGDLVQIVEPE